MLEVIKGYMKEKWKYIIFLLILLLLFYKFGNTYYLENNCILTKYMYNFYDAFILIGLEIATFFWIRFIYYYLSLLVVLNYKKTLLKGDMLFKMVAIILNIIVFETIQFYMLIKFENKNILIILIPYVMMLLIHTLLYGDEENEGKKREIILSFIITIILFVLLPPLENIVLVITIYNIVYLLLGEKLVKLKGIKLLLLFIFLILLFYLGFLFRKNWIEIKKIENDYITMSESSL